MPFICIVDTVFQGRVVSWRDEDGKPCIYETQAEAEVDAVNDDDDENDTVVEVTVTPESIIDTVDGRIYWELVKPLKVGTLHCPTKSCIFPLHFEVFGGMRLRSKSPTKADHYKAICPTCGEAYNVLAPKEIT